MNSNMEDVLLATINNSSVDAEQVLVEAAVGGDVEAFATLYDQHVERVFRYVGYLVGNRADAEDLTQQVFLQAWQAIGRYRCTKASFRAWLLRIAHNLTMSFYRRAKETQQLDVQLPSTARWADPEAAAWADHDRSAVQRAIRGLKPEQRAVIVMRLIEHLDYRDIATALDKSEGNIRVIQHRALAELRRSLAREVNL